MREYLKFVDTQVVYKEFPDEVTLAINISGCPNHCPGCHSPELWENIGDDLTEEKIIELINNTPGITCVGLMGGDNNVKELIFLARTIRDNFPKLHIGWYSGKEAFPLYHGVFDYIKLGLYIEKLGGLDKETTNQRLYMKLSGDEICPAFIDITRKAFWAPKPWDPDYFDYIEQEKNKDTKTI